MDSGDPRRDPRVAPRTTRQRDAFDQFQATALFCPRCRAARPVREHLLLVLPDGDLFEYRCAECGAAVGSRRGDSSIALR